jgi:hypothetical protein
MNTLDPAVRDLLTAIYAAPGASEGRFDVRAAIESMARYPQVYSTAWSIRWLTDRAGEAADARRVRWTDLWDLSQASEELPT